MVKKICTNALEVPNFGSIILSNHLAEEVKIHYPLEVNIGYDEEDDIAKMCFVRVDSVNRKILVGHYQFSFSIEEYDINIKNVSPKLMFLLVTNAPIIVQKVHSQLGLSGKVDDYYIQIYDCQN